jgi:hypothetical protein
VNNLQHKQAEISVKINLASITQFLCIQDGRGKRGKSWPITINLFGKFLFRNINASPSITKEIFIKRHTLTILNISGQ